jgi:molecular chaperone HtpG
MSANADRHEFQAEVKQLLDLMVHSLYSNKDIFLRELISNASDALDRRRFEQLTDEGVRHEGELGIWIEADRENRLLTISDNGIGMSRDEVIANLGTIARSGTKAFMQGLAEAKRAGAASPELIGQFGVGFYSAFMVADELTVVTRRAGAEHAVRWVSTGDGYTVEDAHRAEAGTTITLKLKPADEEAHLSDYTDEWVIKQIVKRYSDFVAYPVKMKTWEDEDGGKVLKESVLNSQKAIWARPKEEVTDEELNEFYRHISHDWHPPLTHVSVRMEGTFEAQGLLFIPETAPFDLFHPEMKRGVQLYVKRVFIMDECKELVPGYLRFVKGVVDAQDLSLNVSREILQKDRQIRVIRKNLVKKVFDTLEEIAKGQPDKYAGFWKGFGQALKEGLVNGESKEQERILELMLAPSTHDASKLTSLADYVARMKDGQDVIYYITGPSLEAVQRSPHLEAFKAKGYEVIFLTDPIDEIWVERGLVFGEKTFRSVGQGEVELGTEEEKKAAEEKREAKEKELKDLLTTLRAHLQDDVKEVRLSSRLTDSPVCLVGETGDLTPQMEKLMKAMGQEVPKTKRILELNPDHAVTAKLEAMFAADPKAEGLKQYAELLYGQALLAEGGVLPDPVRFSTLVTELMVR